jgi:hypothetical protein
MSNTKRKRESEKGIDAGEAAPLKKFQCDFEGCGKSYSRAEHLARHALNHSPREIYRCEFQGCDRWFVRQDLCTRHYERHFQTEDSPNTTGRAPIVHHGRSGEGPSSPKKRRVGRPKLSEKGFGPHTSHEPAKAHTTEDNTSLLGRKAQIGPTDSSRPVLTPSLYERVNANGASATTHNLERVNPQDQTPHGSSSMAAQPVDPSLTDPQSYSGYMPTSQTHNNGYDVEGHKVGNENTAYGMQASAGVFPNYYDQISESPGSARHNDEFTTWLFDDLQNFYSGIGSIGLQNSIGIGDGSDDLYGAYADHLENSTMPGLMQQDSHWSHVSAPDSINQATDSDPQHWLDENRWRQLVEFLRLFFNNEGESSRGHFDRAALFGGDLESEDHVLGFRLMNTYIATYWHSYHDQMPILHKPTFVANDTPELLLLAVVMIGASHIPSTMGEYIKGNAHHLATFIAWHIRWHIFMHDHFHPPAKLWVFQALVLLEVFEKLKTTRFLHERANLHIATTINLFRRGTALRDTSSLPDMNNGGLSQKDWWRRWIEAESTRRAAFAAFLLDATHGSMFGHAIVMIPHEVLLPLPCDDALWSASSAEEVGRIEASLYTNNVRPLTFLQGLKRMLNNRKVRTNAFGRMVLLAGLQSVSWHMRQREKVSNLGRGLGTPEIWRQTLTRAFDFWKKDSDEDIANRQRAFIAWQNTGIFADSRTLIAYAGVMHHLSHLAMHMDSHDAQILAGAPKMLSRTVTAADRERASRRLSHWRETPAADMAFQHAVQLLLEYLPEGDGLSPYNASDDTMAIRPWTLYYAALTAWSYIFVTTHPREQMSAASSDSSGAMESRRPSPERDVNVAPNLASDRRQVSDLHLQPRPRDTTRAKTMNVDALSSKPPGMDKLLSFSPSQLIRILNALADTFGVSRWELAREASDRLRTAVEMLAGTGVSS